MKLVLLGTGTPNLEHDRSQSALAIVLNDEAYLVDCGGGAVQRLAQAAHRHNITPLASARVKRVFLTHLHPDHTVGLADLLIGGWVEGRVEPMHIYGPAGTQKLCDLLLAAHEIGISEHVDGIAPIEGCPRADVTEIEAGVIYKGEQVQIEAFRVEHGSLDAFGYKFMAEGKTVVMSGDTCYLPELAQIAMDCDILVHEVCSARMLETRPEEWQRYHRQYHTTTTQLAELVNIARPKWLVLTHQLLWGTTPEALVAEITQTYNGEVIYGRDLDVVEV